MCVSHRYFPGSSFVRVFLSQLVLFADAAASPLPTTAPEGVDVAVEVPRAGLDGAGAAEATPQAGAAEGVGTVLVDDVREAFDVQAAFTVSAGETQTEAARRALDEAHRAYALVFTGLDGERETSELARLNRAAGGEPVSVSPLLFALLRELREVALLSGGAFDPTDGPLREAAASAAIERLHIDRPSTSPSLDLARELVSYESLRLDAPSRRAAMAREGQSVRLGRVAYARALQAAADSLRGSGFPNYALRAGSEVVVSGEHDGRSWRIGVQDPGGQGYFAVLERIQGYVSTAGEYEPRHPTRGALEHSALDPRSGVLVEHLRSVTIVSEEPARAASLARAVFVLGPEAGLALVRRLSRAEALIVTADNRVMWTDGLTAALRWRAPSPGSSRP